MNNLKSKIYRAPQGMTMVIVMTIIFLVLAIIGAGVVILANNLNHSGGQAATNKVQSSTDVALEKVKGIYKINSGVFKVCNTGDCFNVATGSCLACSDPAAIITEGDLKYKIEISSLTQSQKDVAGSITLAISGYYKNLTKQTTNTMCLSYCSVSGYNCGDDGCGGSCGTCAESDTCGGGGQANVCGSGNGNCSDISLECDANCPVGSTCGGGTVVDANNHIVAAPGGCEPTGGCPQGGGTDTYSAIWDTDVWFDTGANDYDNGENNKTYINAPRYQASYSCTNSNYNGFSGWYLPAINELNTLAEQANIGKISGYVNGCYWSSTQDANGKPSDLVNNRGLDPNSAICDGSLLDKNTNIYVRCVRRYGGQILAACQDYSEECTANCVNGDHCGGGTVIDSKKHIVASLSACDGDAKCSENGDADTSTAIWDNIDSPQFTGAQSLDDGEKNTNTVPSDPEFEVTNYCKNSKYYGFRGWFLPAFYQFNVINEAISQGWTAGWNDACYWSSTETNFEPSLAYQVGAGAYYGNCNEGPGSHKQESTLVRCLRTYN